jgi:hypothetical protein
VGERKVWPNAPPVGSSFLSSLYLSIAPESAGGASDHTSRKSAGGAFDHTLLYLDIDIHLSVTYTFGFGAEQD